MNFPELFGIPTAYADALGPVSTFVGKVNKAITNPLIVLMFAAALMYFLYGVFEFLSNSEQAEARETGHQHMIWGIIGMVIMFGVFAILKLMENTLGIQNSSIKFN